MKAGVIGTMQVTTLSRQGNQAATAPAVPVRVNGDGNRYFLALGDRRYITVGNRTGVDRRAMQQERPSIITFTPEQKARLFGLGARIIHRECFARSDLVFEAPIMLAALQSHTLEFVGAYSYSNGAIGTGVSRIGRFCSIAHSVCFGEFEHQTNWLTTSSITFDASSWSFYREPRGGCMSEQPPGIVIGNDVWVGGGAYLRSGITIGDGAIIGARAVVTKDVPPFAVVVGNPGRIVRYRFSPSLIEAISITPWWDYDVTQLDGHVMRDPERAMQSIINGVVPPFHPSTYSIADALA
jgi:acetyltransferase-like isoleucine patch superfamily enzyme